MSPQTVNILAGDNATRLGVILVGDHLFSGDEYMDAFLDDTTMAGSSQRASDMGARLMRLLRASRRSLFHLLVICLLDDSFLNQLIEVYSMGFKLMSGWSSATIGTRSMLAALVVIVLRGLIGRRLLCLFLGTNRRLSSGNVAALDLDCGVTCWAVLVAIAAAATWSVLPSTLQRSCLDSTSRCDKFPPAICCVSNPLVPSGIPPR